MGSEWVECKLKDVLGHVADNRGKNPKSYSEKGIPVIDNYLITNNWRINLGGAKRYIDDQTYRSFIRKHIKKDDVLITLVGNGYGQVAITPLEKCVIIQNTIGLRCNENNDNKYLYYLLKGSRDILMNLNIGAAQPSIKVGNLLDVRFRFAPLSEQKAIAHILGTLDDKIELNRQMNATLEAMAQALFKSWFVDFDPVIDNALAAGNPIPEPLQARAEARKVLGEQRKSLPEAIQKQFPNRFVFNEGMGWVPEGWGVSAIGNVLDLAYGKSLPAAKRIDGTFQVYGSGGVSGFHNEPLVNGPGIIVGRKGTVGSLYWVEQDFYPIDTVFYVVNKSEAPLYWLYQTLGLLDIKSMGADSAVPGVNRNAIYVKVIALPQPEVFEKYVAETNPISSRRQQLLAQNEVLGKLRDTLLPKLLSGQLRIPDVEKQVAEAI